MMGGLHLLRIANYKTQAYEEPFLRKSRKARDG
jgi:hypothetical protein